MTALRAAALALVVVLAGCGPDKPSPAPTPKPTPATAEPEPTTARPGAYCRQAGQRAVTDAGRPVVCTTTTSDDRLRWRAGS